ncbi:MAG: ribbon-helix-helix protein, CopG family [Nitrososphaerota archaeon]
MTDKKILKEHEMEKNERTLNKVLSSKRRGLRFVGVFLPVEMFGELEKIAREEERTISQLVRLAVRKYLERRKNAEAEK